MTEGRHQITQASRPFNDASLDMGRPPQTSRACSRTGRATLTAGTLGTVGDDTAREHRERHVVLRDSNRYDPHGMESHDSTKDTFGRGGASFRDSGEGVPTGSLRDAPGKAALSTDFPGQPFGPGDTITIVNAWNVAPTDHEPREWYDEAERLRQSRLRRWQAIR